MDQAKHVVLDLLAILAPALTVLAAQLEQAGFSGVSWSTVVAAGIGGLLAWSRVSSGGLR